MNDELVERVLSDDEPVDSTDDRGSIKWALDDHRPAFGLFIVSGGTLTVMFVQGLVAGKLSVGLLPLFVIPGYCLFRIWRGVQSREQEAH
jgi:hypothetical protein